MPRLIEIFYRIPFARTSRKTFSTFAVCICVSRKVLMNNLTIPLQPALFAVAAKKSHRAENLKTILPEIIIISLTSRKRCFLDNSIDRFVHFIEKLKRLNWNDQFTGKARN